MPLNDEPLGGYTKYIMADLTLLLVEDDPILQDLYADRFRQAGMQVLQAADGQIAIELIDSHPEISIILLDLMLPKISGYDVLVHVRQQRGHAFPVVIVSALADIDDQAKGLQLGATDYLTKGELPPSEVVSRIKEYAKATQKNLQK